LQDTMPKNKTTKRGIINRMQRFYKFPDARIRPIKLTSNN
jgi:hypothetical protein